MKNKINQFDIDKLAVRLFNDFKIGELESCIKLADQYAEGYLNLHSDLAASVLIDFRHESIRDWLLNNHPTVTIPNLYLPVNVEEGDNKFKSFDTRQEAIDYYNKTSDDLESWKIVHELSGDIHTKSSHSSFYDELVIKLFCNFNVSNLDICKNIINEYLDYQLADSHFAVNSTATLIDFLRIKYPTIEIPTSMESVAVLCYDDDQIFDTREDAIKFYQNYITLTDGSERNRYVNIYVRLLRGVTYCTDEDIY